MALLHKYPLTVTLKYKKKLFGVKVLAWFFVTINITTSTVTAETREMFIRAYLRASTDEQNAERAKDSLDEFAQSQSVKIANYYTENASGATLNRPELNRLLQDCQKGDIILIESIDRLTRLKDSDWNELKGQISRLGVRIVALDLPTSHIALKSSDELTDGILNAINSMMIDVMAVFARKDYELRRERQEQGMKKAKAQGKYRGRQADTKKYQQIIKLLESGIYHREVCELLKCSPSTIQKAMKWHGGIDQRQLAFR